MIELISKCLFASNSIAASACSIYFFWLERLAIVVYWYWFVGAAVITLYWAKAYGTNT